MKLTQKLMIATLLGAFAASGAMAGAGVKTGLPETTKDQVIFTGEVVDFGEACEIEVVGGDTISLGQFNAAKLANEGDVGTKTPFTINFNTCKSKAIADIKVAAVGTTSANHVMENTGLATQAKNVGVSLYNNSDGLLELKTGPVSIKKLVSNINEAEMEGSKTVTLKAAMRNNGGGAATAGNVKSTMTITVSYN